MHCRSGYSDNTDSMTSATCQEINEVLLAILRKNSMHFRNAKPPHYRVVPEQDPMRMHTSRRAGVKALRRTTQKSHSIAVLFADHSTQ